MPLLCLASNAVLATLNVDGRDWIALVDGISFGVLPYSGLPVPWWVHCIV